MLTETRCSEVFTFDETVVEHGGRYWWLGLVPDTDVECPLDWAPDSTGFIKVSESRGGYAFGVSIEDSDSDLLGYAATEADLWEMLAKRYKRRGYDTYRTTLTGSSQGDWVEGLVICKPDYVSAEGMAHTLQTYFAGEVASLLLEEIGKDEYRTACKYGVGAITVDAGSATYGLGGIYFENVWTGSSTCFEMEGREAIDDYIYTESLCAKA